MPFPLTVSRRAFIKASAAAAPWVGAGVIFPSAAAAAPRGRRSHILVPRAGRWIDADPHALAQRAVDAAMAAGAHYADARLTLIRREDWFEGELTTPLSNDELYGVGVRALRNGCWGYFSSAVWAADEMVRLGQGAVAQASASVRGAAREVSLGTIPRVTNGVWVMPVKYDPFTISLAEKSDYMDSIRGIMHRYSPMIAGGVTASFQRVHKYFASSEGSSWMQTTYLTEGEMNLRYAPEVGYGKYNGGGAAVQTLTAAGQGWEYIAESGLPEQIPALAELAAATRDQIPLDVGRYDLVCSPYATASITSLSIGAATELDRALGYEANAEGTSFLDNPLEMLGKYQVGSSLLTLSANRSQPGGAATVHWDDEAVTPETFTLIDKGIVVDYQTTREQASWLAPYYDKAGKAIRSHGCALSQSALDIPLQQPPNLRLHGSSTSVTFDEMVAGTDHGLAVLDINLNMDSQCLNGIAFGSMREIRKGKLGKFVAGGVLAIRTPELWKNLAAVGSDSAAQWFGVRRKKGEPTQYTYHSVGAVPTKFAGVPVVNFMGRM